MTRKLLLLAGCVVWLGNGALGCDKPAEAPQSAVQVPDYSITADETTVPDERAALAAWSDYQDSVFHALSSSSNPRDWALAVVTAALKFDSTGDLPRNRYDDLIERAMRAAPDDALVQWIAMNQGEATHDVAMQTLRALEPDNAALWIDDLTTATKRNDDAGIRAALAKISGRTRFDLHYVDLLKAATEAYLRSPVPDTYFAAESKDGDPLNKDELAYTNAMTITAAVALPAFQYLVNACRIDPISGKNGARAADCATIGRLMATRGDTLIANRIGDAILRVSHTYMDDDLRFARNMDWVYQKATSASPSGSDSEIAKDFIMRYHDWIDTGSEVESMRRALVRQGVAPTPPEDWVDTWSSFSAERLHGDAAWFEKNASK